MPRFRDNAGEGKVEQLKKVNIPVRTVMVRTVDSAKTAAPARTYKERIEDATVTSQETQNDIEKEHLNKLRQQQKQRRAFFVWAMITISSVLLASGLFMAAYMIVKGNETEPAVIIAWLSSGLVETLGLGYIIANYLFEQNGIVSKKKQRKNRGGKSKN